MSPARKKTRGMAGRGTRKPTPKKPVAKKATRKQASGKGKPASKAARKPSPTTTTETKTRKTTGKPAARRTARGKPLAREATRKKAAAKPAATKAPKKTSSGARPSARPPASTRKAAAASPAASGGPARRNRAARTPARATVASAEPQSRFGVKYTCFACGAKFYDLNRPEPICPKCATDQRSQPKVTPKTNPAKRSSRSRGRSMAPLLAEDDDEAIVVETEEIGLGHGAIGDKFLDAADGDDDDAEES